MVRLVNNARAAVWFCNCICRDILVHSLSVLNGVNFCVVEIMGVLLIKDMYEYIDI